MVTFRMSDNETEIDLVLKRKEHRRSLAASQRMECPKVKLILVGSGV